LRITCEALLNTFSNHFLTQIVHEPTRENKVLDLLAVSHPTLFKHVDVIEGISDHKAIFTTLNTTTELTIKEKRKVYLFEKCDFKKFGEAIESSFTAFLASSKDKNVDTSWKYFLDILRKGIDKYIPHKLKRETKEPRWYNCEVRRELRRQRQSHNSYKSSIYLGVDMKCGFWATSILDPPFCIDGGATCV
jgi:hypothetical protein